MRSTWKMGKNPMPFLFLITTSSKLVETESVKKNYQQLASEPVVCSAVGVELYIWLFLCDSRSMQPGAQIEMNWLSPIKLQLNKGTSLGEFSETSSSLFLISPVGGEGWEGGRHEREIRCVLGRRWARSISSEYSHYEGGVEVMDEGERATEDQIADRQRERDRRESWGAAIDPQLP